MKNLINLFGRFLVVLSIVFLVVKLVRHFHEIPKFTWGPWAYLSISGFIVVCMISGVIASYIWRSFLRGGGVHITFREAYLIIGQSQIGKYLPGNIFHYISRFALARRQGIPTEATLLSTGLETVIVIVVAVAIIAAGWLFSDLVPTSLLASLDSNRPSLALAGITLVAGILTAAFFLPNLRMWGRSRLAYLHAGRIGKAMSLYLINFAVFGIFISILPATLWGINTGLSWYQFIWGFTLAWVLGFVTPGASGGIGIRELVFVGLYGKELGNGLAVGLAVVLRVITSLGDLLTFALAYWLGKRENNDAGK